MRTVVIEDRPVPAPGSRQALIETELTLISTGTELTVLGDGHEVGKNWSKLRSYPVTPGYCNVGTVKQVGEGVDQGFLGQRVQSYGSHAKYVLQPLEMLRPVRPAIPSEQAVFATMAEIALNGVRQSGVRLGQAVAVYGLGILGQLAVRFARLCGARPVLGVEPAANRLALLPDDPAVFPVNPGQIEVRQKVAEVTRGRMADIVIEFSGSHRLIPEQLKVLREQGLLAVVSGPRGTTEIDFLDLVVSPSITIKGLHNMSHPRQATRENPWTKNREVELFFDLVADGDIDVSGLITDKKTYTAAPGLYRRLLEDRTQFLGVLLDWKDSK